MKILVIFHARREGWMEIFDDGKKCIERSLIDDYRKLIIGASQDENIYSITMLGGTR
ncbi:MAG: hypothetical protein F6K24_21780 [Okeania sp. SIO2D1]|nr:hypothetical protein [Okeania sp. SIO2D1]